jgi:hypothetical protein
MDKMKDEAPNFEYPNSQNQNNSPIGYPDMSGMLPSSYPKKMPPTREYVYHSGKLSHSINPERPQKYKGASPQELKSMKLAK